MKNSALPLMLLLLLLFAGCAKYPSSSPEGRARGKAISRTARTAIGVPYKYGGNTPRSGFDCSGLVRWAYAKHGVPVPRTTGEQQDMGDCVPKDALQAGDVVVFKLSKSLHTGVYTGDGAFVHSPSTGKRVREDKVDQRYWREKFVAGRRHRKLQ